MVDLDNLTKFSKSGQYPDLLNSSDVERVKEILEAHPDIFSPRLDELGNSVRGLEMAKKLTSK